MLESVSSWVVLFIIVESCLSFLLAPAGRRLACPLVESFDGSRLLGVVWSARRTCVKSLVYWWVWVSWFVLDLWRFDVGTFSRKECIAWDCVQFDFFFFPKIERDWQGNADTRAVKNGFLDQRRPH